MQRERILSLSSMTKLMQRMKLKRISRSAKESLADILEEYAMELADHAKDIATNAGRTTVKGQDVRVAAKR